MRNLSEFVDSIRRGYCDLYLQAIDAPKLAAQRDIALAITSNQVAAN